MDVTILGAKGLGTLAIASADACILLDTVAREAIVYLSARISEAKKGEWQFGYVPQVRSGDIELKGGLINLRIWCPRLWFTLELPLGLYRKQCGLSHEVAPNRGEEGSNDGEP